MGFAVNSEGKLVELQEVEVENEAELEQRLQEEADAAQNELNVHTANLTNAEEALAAAEAQADAANQAVEEARVAKEAAEAAVTKSTTKAADFRAAVELRNAQPQPETSEGDGGDAESPEGESEAVPVPVNVGQAAG